MHNQKLPLILHEKKDFFSQSIVLFYFQIHNDRFFLFCVSCVPFFYVTWNTSAVPVTK